MSVSNKLATRRRVLQGMMGGAAVSVGLPFLDCFLDTNGTALAATNQALPVVYGTWYWGLGFNPGRWEPGKVGKIEALGPETQVLDPIKHKMNFFSGLKVHLDGRPSITHFTGNMSLLTGTTPSSGSIVTPTIDTLIADHIGATTRFKSIELTATGNAKHMYSYRPGGVFQPAEASPAELYTRIYGSGFRDPNAAEFTPDPQVLARRSVLTAVKEQRQDLQKMLGASDRARLDEYFTSLRQLEQQLDIQLTKPAPLAACSLPEQPEQGPLGTDVDIVTANHRLLARLAAHAFACDQTHVVNLAFSDMTSSLRRAGSPMIHHIYTHEEAVDEKLGYQPNATFFINRNMEGLLEYLTVLDSIKEGGGTLLDRALIMAISDTGYARTHSLDNIPMMTAGSAAGRIKTGLHIAAPGDPATRLGLTVQQALGMSLNSWGTASMTTSKTITEILA